MKLMYTVIIFQYPLEQAPYCICDNDDDDNDDDDDEPVYFVLIDVVIESNHVPIRFIGF